MGFQSERALIYCKTYPELSIKHKETVCTAAVSLTNGKPIRLYPVPLRYLDFSTQYQLYDVIDVPIEKSRGDSRPESFRIRPDGLSRREHLGTERDWEARREVVFREPSWHYRCLEELKERQRADASSLGVVPVGAVDWVRLGRRPEQDRLDHEERLKANAARIDLFDTETRKSLEFLPFRVRLRWHCGSNGQVSPTCPGHTAAILDWGLLELGRREGEEASLKKAEILTDLSKYDLHLFVGNFFLHQHVFGIIGLWYPPRRGWKHQLPLPLGS